jgi:hypothetical protein
VQVGFGEEVITPPNPVGHVLAGYITRRGVSKGVHDDIYIRVLFIEAERPLAIASLDLLAVDERIVEDLRRISQGALGAALTVVAATHTHSAPATLFSNPLLTYGSETFREDYYQFFLERAERAFEAASSTHPASASLHTAQVIGVGTDRSDPRRSVGNVARILSFDSPTGRVLLVNYGIHPTVLGPRNLYISSDLVGYAVKHLREGGRARGVVFTNSAAANVSTRYTRRAQSFEEAERLGRALAEQVLEAISTRGEELPLEQILVEKLVIQVEYDDPRSKLRELLRDLPGLVARSRKRRVRALAEALAAALFLAGMRRRASLPRGGLVEVDWVRINGRLGILALPFELHTDIAGALEARAASAGLRHFMVVSYANGYHGYLAPEEELSYERLAQLLSASSRRMLLEEISSLCARKSV